MWLSLVLAVLGAAIVIALGIAQYRRWTAPALEVVAGLFPPKAPDTIRIMSCNVQGIPVLHQGDRMAAFLRRCQSEADVVCFQELFSTGAIEHVREALAGWTLLLPRAYASGLCIATRLRASVPRLMHYSAGAWADRFVTKGAMALDVSTGGAPLTVVVTHMQNSGPIASQYTELREWLQEPPPGPTLLVGDFNVDPTHTSLELPQGATIVRTHSATHESGELDYGWACGPVQAEVERSDPAPADHTPLLYRVKQLAAGRTSPCSERRPRQQRHRRRRQTLSRDHKSSEEARPPRKPDRMRGHTL